MVAASVTLQPASTKRLRCRRVAHRERELALGPGGVGRGEHEVGGDVGAGELGRQTDRLGRPAGAWLATIGTVIRKRPEKRVMSRASSAESATLALVTALSAS